MPIQDTQPTKVVQAIGPETAGAAMPNNVPPIADSKAPIPPAAPVAPAKEPALIPKKAPAPKTPKTTKKVTQPSDAELGAMERFLLPSKTFINRAEYTKEELAGIDERMNTKHAIETDAVNNLSDTRSLHVLLGGGKDALKEVPGARSLVNVDVDLMARNINDPARALSDDEKYQYGRALEIFRDMKAKNFNVMKGPSGIYWLESIENGKKVYASNGILEVAELLDKFSEPPATVPTTPAEKKQAEELAAPHPKKLADKLIKNPDKDPFNESDQWRLRALATDLGTSLAGVAGKVITAGSGGAGWMAGAAGTAVSVVGGLAALGMEMRGDWLDKDVSAGQMFKNAGIRLGLEAMETVSIIPASTIASLKGISKAGKLVRSGITAYMAAGVITTAVGTDWMSILKKIDSNKSLNMEDYKKLFMMAQFITGTVGAGVHASEARKNMTTNLKRANTPLEPFATKKRAGMADESGKVIEANRQKTGDAYEALRKKASDKSAAKVAETKALATQKRKAANTNAKSEAEALESLKAEEMLNIHNPVVTQTLGRGKNKRTVHQSTIADPNDPAVIKAVDDVDAKYAGEHALIAKKQQKTKADISKERKAENARISADNAARQQRLSARETTQKEVHIPANQKAVEDKKIAWNLNVEQRAGRRQFNRNDASTRNIHGEVISNKLRARAEKAAGVPVSKRKGPEPTTKEPSKLDEYNKEKAALQEKNKDLDPNDITPEDKKAMQDLDDMIAAQTKKDNSRSAKLIAKAKGAISSSKSLADKSKGRATAAMNRVAVHDGQSGNSLGKAYQQTDSYHEGTGRRHYDYDLPKTKALLMAEGYEEAEIDKYTLTELRRALRNIENEKAAAKRKTPKKHLGGRLVARHIPMRIFTSGGTAPATSSGKVVDAVVKPIASSGNLIDINGTQAPGSAEEYNKKLKQKADDLDKYNKIIAGAKVLKAMPNPPKDKLESWFALIKDFKTSDLFIKNKMFIEKPFQEDIIAPVLRSRGVRMMPGIQDALARTTLQPRRETADSFEHGVTQVAVFNDAERRRNELVARNAGFVESSRDEDTRILNDNIAAQAAADNANIQRKNANEANYANQLAQGKANLHTLNEKKRGRLVNALTSGIAGVYQNRRAAELNSQAEAILKSYNEAASYKSKWNNEYKARFDAAVASNDPNSIAKVKSDFVTETAVNPDELDLYMTNMKDQYRTLAP